MIDYYSHTYDISYNDYIITQYWKRNGGGEYGELGQLMMGIGQNVQWPEAGTGYGGFEDVKVTEVKRCASIKQYTNQE